MSRFFFAKGIRIHNQLFEFIRNRYNRIFETNGTGKRKTESDFANVVVGRYIDEINYLNQIICDSKPSEVRALESLTVDEYYQTVSTWMRIMDEKNKAVEKINSGDDEKPKERRKFGKAKKV